MNAVDYLLFKITITTLGKHLFALVWRRIVLNQGVAPGGSGIHIIPVQLLPMGILDGIEPRDNEDEVLNFANLCTFGRPK